MSLSNLPPKILVEISLSLLDENNFNWHSPWDNFDKNMTLVKESSSWTGVNIEEIDVEFISKFIGENFEIFKKFQNGEIKKNEVLSSVKIPKLKKYELFYEVWGNATVYETYKVKRSSYDEDWVENSFSYDYYNGDFHVWNGEFVSYYYDNFDYDNFEIQTVQPLEETKKSMLSKLVVENTTDVLDNLDRDTLLELRNMINQKLSSWTDS